MRYKIEGREYPRSSSTSPDEVASPLRCDRKSRIVTCWVVSALDRRKPGSRLATRSSHETLPCPTSVAMMVDAIGFETRQSERGVGIDRRGVADFADSVTLQENYLVVVHNSHRYTGNPCLLHAGADVRLKLGESGVDAVGGDSRFLLSGANQQHQARNHCGNKLAHQALQLGTAS